MIENTILDRESEIIFNHSAADDNTFVDHGSYVDQGMMQVQLVYTVLYTLFIAKNVICEALLQGQCG